LVKGTLVAALLGCSTLQAATSTWTGGSGANSNWSTAANWGGTATANGNALVFGGTTRLTPNNDTLTGISSLTFSAGAGAFGLGGNALTISSGVTNNATNLETVNNTLTLTASQTWTETSTGGLTFAAVNLSNSATSNTLTVSGGAATSITGIIANGGTSTAGALTYSGTGTLTLTGADTYGGATTISSGTLQIGNGGATGNITSSSSIVDNGALVFDSSSNVSYTAVISGTGTITQNGSGTITLSSAANTETGIINLNAGVISVIGAGHLGATPATLIANYLNFNGGTLEVSTNGGLWSANRGVTLNAGGGTWQSDVAGIANQLGGVVTGAGNFTKTGAGTLEFDGLNTNTGATIVSAGTLQVGIANATSNASALTVDSGATFNLTNGTTGFADAVGSIAGAGNITMAIAGSALTIGNDNTSTNFSGVISGVGTLTKVGTGTETLSGVNTYTGATTINGGTLSIGADDNLGTAPGAVTANDLNFGGGTLQTTGTFTLSSNRGVTLNAGGGTFDTTSGTTLTYGGIVAGTGALTKTDTGTLVLSGANTYTGATTINGGTLSIGADDNLGTAPGAVTANDLNFGGGTLHTSGTFTLSSNRGITLNAGGGTIDTASGTTLTYGGIVAGAGALTKTSAGTLTLSSANSYTGGTTINAGTVNIGNNTSLGTNTVSFTGNSTLQAGATLSNVANALSISSGVTATVDTQANNLTFSGNLSSADSTGMLTKIGAGTLTLSGTNAFTGTLNISTGTVKLGASQTFTGGTIDLASGSTLNLNGFNLTAGALNVTGSSGTATIDFSGTSILDLTNALNSLTISAGVTLDIVGWTNAVDYFYSMANPGSTVLSQISFSSPYAGDPAKWITYEDGPDPNHQISPVPEPATYGALFTAAALGLFFWLRLKANTPRLVPVRVAARY
jgi:autotransporter-associated beta strand protein